MSEKNSFTDLVFSLSNKDFQLLQGAVALRRDKEHYGVTNFLGLAKLYGRVPTCPYCDSDEYVSFGLHLMDCLDISEQVVAGSSAC